MNFEMQKANMLAEHINGFIQYVQRGYKRENSLYSNKDKLFQIKLWMEEFKFQIIADEILRINQFSWDEKYTYYLVDQFRKGINIIEEYVTNNYNDLFLFTARLYTLKNLIQLLQK
ncbi:hypothetical protein BACCIP111895_02358 [Neobacillus rhizosphaerae]|uniref:DUF1798 domain-containing protein n=1 Tax=Neobacillus rhizosphaerae TaxID=2880965 RepID=A0ABN8KRJ6_9BACI|nr:hypothetical protein [Neobacillus rhizosphaerae]CAH2715174.1 hypothetical protein BACCIP111895_02358 [Neobacillus rhizosphaerae]